MKRTHSTLVAALLVLATHAQDRDALLVRARQYLDTLTAPAMHGRGYVSGGDALAAEYLARQFQRIGSPVSSSSCIRHPGMPREIIGWCTSRWMMC